MRSEGGELVLRGKTADGEWEERVRVPASRPGEGSAAVVTLFGRERVEDVEMRSAGGLAASEADASIESLGLAYRIATRLTSWVAIDSQPSVDPRDPSRRVEMPQALPYGTSAEGLGLRASMAMSMQSLAAPAFAGPGGAFRARAAGAPPAPPRAVAPRSAPPAEADDESEDGSERTLGEAAMKKQGFLDRLTGAFTGKSRRTLVWIARVVLARPGEIVLEITVDGESLAWKVAPRVQAQLGRSMLELAVDATRTTRDGTYEPGTTVRLVLQVPPDFDPSELAEVSMNGVQMTIRA